MQIYSEIFTVSNSLSGFVISGKTVVVVDVTIRIDKRISILHNAHSDHDNAKQAHRTKQQFQFKMIKAHKQHPNIYTLISLDGLLAHILYNTAQRTYEIFQRSE